MNVWNKQYIEKGFNSQREYPNESLIAFVKTNCKKNDKILEIGCGSGANIWFLAKEGYEVYGVDYADTGIMYCQKMLKKWGGKAKIKKADMRKLPYSNNQFNSIVDIVSMQHLKFKDHVKCLREIYRCLKKNGKFFSYHLGENSVSYLNGGGKLIDKNTIDNIRDETKPLANNGQTCFLSRNDYYELLREGGFRNIQIDKIIKSYFNQKFYIEYLVVIASK